MSSVEQTHRFGDPEPPRRSWFSRNWGWVALVVGTGGICVCCGGFTSIMMFGFSILKQSDPYVMALESAKNDPRIQEAIGQPIEDVSWIPMGHFEQKNSTGKAEFEFDIAGPKGRAHVHTRAEMDEGKWNTTFLEVDIVGGEKYKLR
jgi:hypothetical protein